jgi:hypothetical protein
MCDEIWADHDHQDRVRAPDEWLDILQRYDGLITEAEGDAPLREFWRLSKCKYQENIEQVGIGRQGTDRLGGGLLARGA